MNIAEIWWNWAGLDFEIQPNSIDLAEKSAQNLDSAGPNFPCGGRIC
jgi:hypothetical protein